MTSKTVRAVINQPVGNVLVPGTPGKRTPDFANSILILCISEPLSEPPSSPVVCGLFAV